MSSLIGQTVGRYLILEQLGEGGMATVYKAQDTVLERFVAIKMIRTDQFPPSMLNEMLRRFEREAKSLAKLSHPNIVHVHDYGEYQGAPYLVMEYLPSGTIKNRPESPMPWREALNLLIPIAQALAYAHEQGIIHRDIKPGNILLTDKGRPMLSDFGIAKLLENKEGSTLTGTGMTIGTPEYMAPEQWTGEASPQSDIYSLGVVLYEMVTARKPYIANTPVSVMLKQVNEPLPLPSLFVKGLPENLENIIVKALQKLPADRYGSMGEFAAEMEGILTSASRTGSVRVEDSPAGKTMLASGNEGKTGNNPIPVASVPTPTRQQLQKTRKAGRWIPIGALIVLLCIGGTVGAILAINGLRAKIPLTGQPRSTPGSTLTAAGNQPISTTLTGGQSDPAGAIKVLWDISHGPRASDNGTAFTPDGMYKSLAKALGNEKIVINGGDLSNLDGYDVLVISEASGKTPYSNDEAASIENFVRTSGHGLLIMTDNPGLENLADSLSRRFSISLGEVTSEGPASSLDEPFFSTVQSLKFLNGGGIFQVASPSQTASTDTNGNSVIAFCECGAGRVLAVADTNLWDINGLNQGDNQQFALNAFKWLAKVIQ